MCEKTYKREHIKGLIKDMLYDCYEKMVADIDKALDSGAIDVESWDPHVATKVLPKTILTAILAEHYTQYAGIGTSSERKVKKDVKNIKYFL